jgi:hypothetical protein
MQKVDPVASVDLFYSFASYQCVDTWVTAFLRLALRTSMFKASTAAEKAMAA